MGRVAAELAVHLDGDLGFDSVAAVWGEIERLAPAYRGITGTVLEVDGGSNSGRYTLRAHVIDGGISARG